MPQRQRPQLVRHRNWSSKLKIPMRSAPILRTRKSQILPYQDWVSQLSPEEHETRIMLMDQGFDIQEIEFHIASSSKLALFKGGSKPGNLSERAVCWAALNDKELALKMLIARGCGPSTQQEGTNIAVLAAETEKWDIVTLLVKSGVDVYSGYNIELVPRYGDSIDYWIPRVKYKGTSQISDAEESRFVEERVLVHIAADSNRCDIITLLLDLGTDVDICMRTPWKSTSKKFNQDLPEHLSWSALQIATQKCSFEAVELLLKRGAHVNKRTYMGDNALKFAVMGKEKKRCVDLVRLLLRYGAAVNALDGDGKTLLVCVMKLQLDNNKKTSWWRRLLDIVRVLLEAGAYVNARDKDNISPLRIATKIGNENLVKLLDNGAHVNAPMNAYGYRFLSDAADCKSDEKSCTVVKPLFDAGAYVFLISEDKRRLKLKRS